MKITIGIKSNKKQVEHSISARNLVGCLVLISLFAIVSSRSTSSVDENIARIQLAQSKKSEELAEIQKLREEASSQVAAVLDELAALKATQSALSAKNIRLADELGIDVSEITVDSSQLPLEQTYINAELTKIENKIKVQHDELRILENVVLGQHISEQSEISGRPVKKGWLSSYYGMRADPFTGQPAMHKGLDFAGAHGNDVVATAAGIVVWSGNRSGYGMLIEIDHGDGYLTRYGHNQSLEAVVGDVVTKGQVIAKMGSTGRSTGAHVHYEVLKNGKHVDPYPFLSKR